MSSKAASREEMEGLHNEVVIHLRAAIKAGEAGASLLAVARQMVRDAGISPAKSVLPKEDTALETESLLEDLEEAKFPTQFTQ